MTLLVRTLALVLGSKVEQEGTPSPRLRARLDRTLELFRDGWFAFIIASGGLGKEGAAMRPW
jgi:vancomycin permeability regulator SanA